MIFSVRKFINHTGKENPQHYPNSYCYNYFFGIHFKLLTFVFLLRAPVSLIRLFPEPAPLLLLDFYYRLSAKIFRIFLLSSIIKFYPFLALCISWKFLTRT